MTLFVVLGVLLVAGAVLFTVLPLARRSARPAESRDAVNAAVYRDQLRELDADVQAGTLAPDQRDKARQEIEARLASDLGKGEPAPESRGSARGAALALGLAVPICALAIYLTVGNPRALSPEATAEAGPHGVTAQQFETMVERLSARMKERPDDLEGWMMLGRSYAVLGHFPQSAAAYAKAVALAPNDAQLLADYADSLAMAQGRTLKGEPEKVLKRALAADPNNVKALVLAGTAAYDRNDKAAAVQLWERALAVLPAESEMARRVRASVAEVRGESQIAQAPKVPKVPKAAAGARVSGTVKVDPKLAGKIGPDDTVFIFARAAEGPRMPLAIMRRQGRDLPVKFTLDDSMAMAPQMNLSAFPRVVIGARVSKSANAAAQPGDLQGSSGPISVGSERVDVTIDTEVR